MSEMKGDVGMLMKTNISNITPIQNERDPTLSHIFKLQGDEIIKQSELTMKKW